MKNVFSRGILGAALAAALLGAMARPAGALEPANAAAQVPALRRALTDLAQDKAYTQGAAYLQRLADLEKRLAEKPSEAGARERLAQAATEFAALKQDALLANPLLNFDKLLFVKRPANAPSLGLPQNWQGNCSLSHDGFDDEIAVLSPVKPQGSGGTATTLYKPGKKFVGDVRLNFDADKMLFSSVGTQNRWQIFEVGADGKNVRQVTPADRTEVDSYDPCYLPNGKIVFCSTACFQGVPCVGGGDQVANLYVMDPDGTHIRQLTFDQDHDWCPTLQHDGRLLYTRWEYSDTPHYFTRILFSMNPDGSGQMQFTKSNSYWPNSTYYSRPIPGQATEFVAVISGHHGTARAGELVLFDPARGRSEADGAIQKIPGWGKKVEPRIEDTLVDGSYPRFLHPYPLSDKYFLVACQPQPGALWGIYLVDIFDNMLLLREEPGAALLEPVVFRSTPRPPVIPDKVDPTRKDATMYLADIYAGPGLAGVPRGTIKSLRLYELHFAYNQMGGHINVGIDGPWDVHRIMGTVPVESDGSAFFKVPANTPLAVQPLDEQGRALQLMRSWMTAMPGESVSCVGCHESPSTAIPRGRTLATARGAVDITPWHGPTRGFDFKREVQPVLDKYCIGCHDGAPNSHATPDFRLTDKTAPGNFTSSYAALHRYVRRPGPESDYHMQKPGEFAANTSELIQMLQKGHHGVQLDSEAWDRLYTWIDLNVPDHGTWTEHRQIAGQFHDLRAKARALYAGIEIDPELIPTTPAAAPKATPVKPAAEPAPVPAPACPNWPFDAAHAKDMQTAAGVPALKVDLGNNLNLDLVLVPAGEFVMGDSAGAADERTLCRVKIDRPFYMGRCTITNRQYAAFDAAHDSRVISEFNKDQSNPGQVANRPDQPVIRVSWSQALAYCQWLSQKTGRHFTLPTEAQWEWACRGGTNTAMNYGDLATDFGHLANLADRHLNDLCRRDNPRWLPTIESVDDGACITTEVGRYKPNAWGLCDMHGNVSQWTLSGYRPYPYVADDGRNNLDAKELKVARGGSFYDRPVRATSAYRRAYPAWQAVFDVGFRVICPADPQTVMANK